MPACRQCSTHFKITSQDEEFYERIDVNPPTLCPDCRRQRRMAHRNERHLYSRNCDLCKKPIISQYHPNPDLTVYCSDCWWSDKWAPPEADFDFNRPFFEQWAELIRKTPQLTLLNFKSENSDYTHLVSNNKSCYLIFSSDYNENCYYSNWLEHCRDSIDGFHNTKCEQTYFSFFCEKLFNCQFCIKSFSSNESNFCYDCRNVQNCTLCWNLRNKQYYFQNKKYSKEEYEKKVADLKLETIEGQKEALQKFKDLMKNEAIHDYRNQLGRNENSSGDYLADTKNCQNCFDLVNSENCTNVSNMVDMKDSYDCEYGGEGEFGIENLEAFPVPRHAIGMINSYAGNDVFYSFNCMRSKNIIGCACLKKNEYCIFNKQYEESEYNKLREKIIEHLKQTGEWGEFLPIKYSLFGYNETNAIDYYKISKEEAEKNKWPWYKEDEEEASQKEYANAKKCHQCNKAFKLIPQEMKFYKNQNLPEPDNCYQCRYSERLSWRNSNKLYIRKCSNCEHEIMTTYAPDRPEKVYCDECYKKQIY